MGRCPRAPEVYPLEDTDIKNAATFVAAQYRISAVCVGTLLSVALIDCSNIIVIKEQS